MRFRKAITFCFAFILSLSFSVSTFAEVPSNMLSVSGSGNIKVAPDIAFLNVGVRTSEIDAETASQKNVEVTNAIVEALKSAGIDEKDIKSQYYYVNPMYDYSAIGRDSNNITGYEVSNSLSITIRKIDEAGKIIDTCITAGANMVNGLSYGVETPSVYYDRLYEKAVSDAGKKASSIAKALGVTLSAPVAISEGGTVNAAQTYVNMNADMKAAGAATQFASTYTAPGDIDLYANVVLTYSYN